jgi:hypothetical protein
MRLIVACNALCSLLHQESILRHDQNAQRKKLASTETETDGRPIQLLPTNEIMHTDAADVGFGEMLDVAGNTEDRGQWQDQGI